jgi:transcriptional regulator with XRE-family HTH domain
VTAPVRACALSVTVGANVRALRVARGWTLGRLGAEAGISGIMISFLEGGQRDFTLPTMEKIAKALGVRAPDLLCAQVPAADEEGGP